MKATRIVPCLLIVVAAVGALAGCTKGPSEDEQKLAEMKQLFAKLGPDDTQSLAVVPWRRLTEEFVAARARKGNGCVGMFDHGQLVAFTWYDLHLFAGIPGASAAAVWSGRMTASRVAARRSGR